MSPKRAGRLAYALIVLVLLGIIGRNVYRRYLNSHLLAAVEAQNVAAVRALLSRGADPNSRMPPETKLDKGALALMAAMKRPETLSREQEEIACLLIQHGADISKEHGYACLPTACRNGSPNIARCLLEHGADPNSPGVSTRLPVDEALDFANTVPFRTPTTQWEAVKQQRLPVSRDLVRLLREHGARLTLWQAARIDDVETIRALLDSGTSVDQLEPRERYMGVGKGATALMLAAKEGSLNATRLLLARGANINAISDYPGTPLLGAIHGRHLDLARLLLRQGANVNIKNFAVMTLLDASTFLPALVPDLVQHGANLKLWGDLALVAAITNKHSELITFLIPQLRRQQNRWGYGALQAALQYQPDLVPLLLARGAWARETPRYANSLYASSLLWYAVHNGRTNLIPSLLHAGANASAHYSDTTPLMEAVGKDPEAVRLLLEVGADANEVTGSGQTPLIAAAQAGNVETIKLLLAHKAEVNGEGKLRHTPLYYAQRHKRPDVITILQQAGGHE